MVVVGNVGTISGLGQGTYDDITVTQTGCTSVADIDVTLSDPPIPVAPTTIDLVYCESDTPAGITTAVTATGILNWYSDSGATISIAEPIIDTSSASTTTYYVTQTDGNSCESATSAVTVTINAIPNAPVANSQIFCSADNPIGSDLIPAISTSITWYSDAALTTPVGNGDALLPGNYYVTETTNGCEGIATMIEVTYDITDTDGDGVIDCDEINDGTDLNDPCSFIITSASVTPSAAWNGADCDGDGVINGSEITDGTNPLDDCSFSNSSITLIVTSTSDCDGDGVTNDIEALDGTDPQDPCSFILANSTVSPSFAWNDTDCDGDGVINGDEVTDGTDPLDACSFILANASVATSTAWNNDDCDGDGVINGTEVIDGTNPLDDCSFITANITVAVISTNDCDGDGVTNTDEFVDGTDPLDLCSFIVTSVTVAPSAAWNATDCDEDGVSNGDELNPPDGEAPTNPQDPCSFRPSDITLPVTTTANCTASIEVTKTASLFGTELGDTITYTIEVENTGNVTLTNLVLVDTFTDVNGNPLVLTQDPVFDGADLGSLEGTLLPGEIATYIATFDITQEAINAGGVSNSAQLTALTPSFEIVIDVTDDAVITELGCLLIFNEFSPNGDGINDTLIINCIDSFPNNTLEVYNRWGNMVYKKRGYSNDWTGISNGRATVNKSEELPVGTYYYILDFGDGTEPKVGWLYINR
jgi:gliding motility-associated-like protein/uncharacterized repeat protein (TIGR01451 family)